MAKPLAVKRRAKTVGARAPHTSGVNKAQAIRDAAKQLGRKVRPKDLIAALAAEGIVVSSPQVSATLKAAGYRRGRRAKRVGMPAAKHSVKVASISLDHLLAAKALADKLGSIEAARVALDVLTKLG